MNRIGQSVIAKQIDALVVLRDNLPTNFDLAVDLLARCEGRIILSGMGKSGLIGAKIAATLSSMGSPSFFVHPGDASHGDLGMITSQDVVLCISKSGESQELSDLIHYCRGLSVPLIAITANSDSNLGKLSNLVLTIPNVEESGIGSAPTTSTTLTLVLGDALAVACASKRGFKETDFQTFHPGGTLGKQFIRVGDIMTHVLPQVHVDTPLDQAIQIMSEGKRGLLLVMDQTLLGVITDGDIRRSLLQNNRTVRSVMSKDPKIVSEDRLAVEVLHEMNQQGISCVPVCRGKIPVGLLHIHDCLKAGL